MEDERRNALGSFALLGAIYSAMAMFFTIVFGVVEGADDVSGPASTTALAFLWAFWGAAVVALGLSVYALVRKGQKRLHALAGTLISGATTVVGFMILWFVV